MPRKPMKPCAVAGCPNLTEKRFCEKHQKEENSRYEKYDRDPAVKRRYGRAWKRIRDSYVKTHPFCEICFDRGVIVPVAEVHHKVPLAEGGTHARDNLVSLCKSCHSKIHAGEKGEDGDAGIGGLSIILGNEAQTIACSSEGKTVAASTITIPFAGYVGITKTACSCTVGTLPSGITVKTNTAATATADGNLVLSVANASLLGGASVMTGNITLTFTISGKTVTKTFVWTKSKAGTNGTNGVNGESAVSFAIYAPYGTIVQNKTGSITLLVAAYIGATEITDATYAWGKFTGGEWVFMEDKTSNYLEISADEIINVQSYGCQMTYGGKQYVDVITVQDKSDPYVSEMLSIGGYTVKNNQGGVVPYVIVRTNQQEVDGLLGPISETAPSSPKAGTYWYKIDHTAMTVTLMKYSGSAWAASTDKQALTYTWYAQDKDGKAVTFGKNGKVIYLSAADIDSIMTLQCDVSNP